MTNPALLSRSQLHDNRFFELRDDTLGLADGKEYHYYSLNSKFDVVVVIPLLDDGRLVLEHIYRHPYGQRMWEFPAGGIEPGEDPLAAGARELEEETGYTASKLRCLQSFEVMPGLLSMRMHLVLAQGLRADGTTALEDMELLEVQSLSQEQAWALTIQPPVSSFLTMGLLALDRHLRGPAAASGA